MHLIMYSKNMSVNSTYRAYMSKSRQITGYALKSVFLVISRAEIGYALKNVFSFKNVFYYLIRLSLSHHHHMIIISVIA